MCWCICIPHVLCHRGDEKMLTTLEWELQAVVGCPTWVLETKLISLGNAPKCS